MRTLLLFNSFLVILCLSLVCDISVFAQTATPRPITASATPRVSMTILNEKLYPYQPLKLKITIQVGDEPVKLHNTLRYSTRIYIHDGTHLRHTLESWDFKQLPHTPVTLKPHTTHVLFRESLCLVQRQVGRNQLGTSIESSLTAGAGSIFVTVTLDGGQRPSHLTSNIHTIGILKPTSDFADQTLRLYEHLKYQYRVFGVTPASEATKENLRQHLLKSKDWKEYKGTNLFQLFSIENKAEIAISHRLNNFHKEIKQKKALYAQLALDEIKTMLKKKQDLGYYATDLYDWESFFTKADKQIKLLNTTNSQAHDTFLNKRYIRSRENVHKHQEIVNEAFNGLVDQKKRYDSEYYGETHAYLIILGEYKVDNAVSLLSESIDFKLKHPPFAGKIRLSSLFPFAHALSKIASLNTVDHMIRNIKENELNNKAMLSIWVLQEICGEERTRQLLEDEVRRTKTDQEKNRLKTAIGFQINWMNMIEGN